MEDINNYTIYFYLCSLLFPYFSDFFTYFLIFLRKVSKSIFWHVFEMWYLRQYIWHIAGKLILKGFFHSLNIKNSAAIFALQYNVSWQNSHGRQPHKFCFLLSYSIVLPCYNASNSTCARGGLNQVLGKDSSPKGYHTLEQAAKGSGWVLVPGPIWTMHRSGT